MNECADRETRDSVVRDVFSSLLHKVNRLHPKNISVLFDICCSRVVDAHPGQGGVI